MKRTLKLWWLIFRFDWARQITYRANFLLMMCGILIELVFQVMFFRFIFNYVPTIAGWNFSGSLLIVAASQLIASTMWLTYLSGLIGLQDLVERGRFDQWLTKPTDSQYHLFLHGIDVEDLIRLVFVGFIATQGFIGLGVVSGVAVLSWLMFVAVGYVAFLSFVFIIKSVTFFIVRSWAFDSLFFHVLEISRFPGGIFRGAARIIFSLVVPILVMTTIPARAAIEGVHWPLVAEALGVTILLVFISRKLWQWSLRHYSSASS